MNNLIAQPKWVQCPNCGTWSVAQHGTDTHLVAVLPGEPMRVCAGKCATDQQATYFGPDDIERWMANRLPALDQEDTDA